MSNWKHDHLAEDLASHLRGTRDRVIWTDMQLGPAGSPRPDVYSIPKSYTKFAPIAYECKISVSDFRRDVTAGKWQSYLKFAAGVIFAVPAGLIKKDDVPPGCGLIIRNEEGWRSVKGPTLQHMDTLPRDVWLKLMIDGLDRQWHGPNPRELHKYRVAMEVRKKYGDRLGAALSNLDNAEHYLEVERLNVERTTEELREQERDRIALARQHVEREMGQITAAKIELAQALGLPGDASVYAIAGAAREAGRRLKESGEIDRMRARLERAQKALAEGLEELPTISMVAA